jgi:hypothetical protein
MSSATLARFSGAALVVGSALGIAAHLLYRLAGQPGTIAQFESPAWIPGQLAQVFGVALILLSLPAVYGRLSGRAGTFGLIAFVLLFIGTMSELMGPINGLWTAELATRPETRYLIESRVMPSALGVVFVVFFPQLLLGAIAFGVSVIRTGVFPRAAGALMIVGVLLDIVGGFILRVGLFGPELVFVGLGWLGLQLVRGAPEPERVSKAEEFAVRSV